MSKTQNILLFISGIIFMIIAIIPLAHVYSAYHGTKPFDYINFYNNTYDSLELFIFTYMFLSINFLIPGINVFFPEKVKKMFSIKRICFSLIMVRIFCLALMRFLFPVVFFLAL